MAGLRIVRFDPILVGHDIVFTVIQISSQQVRIAIEAPKEAEVLRS